MTFEAHPLLARLLRRTGASPEQVPSLEVWRALLALVSRTYFDTDQDRYTIERAMEVSSLEMQGLYQQLEQRAHRELATIRQSDERHRLLFESNPLPIWVLDVETYQFLAVNDAMTRTYGYTRHEFRRMTGADLKRPEDVPEMVRGIREAPPDGMHHVGVRKHRCKDGTLLDMDITVHAITFDARPAMLGIALDTTRARRLEEDLRQAQKMEAIGQLAGGIAHDFNNILAVILANAEFTLDELGTDHSAAGELVEIKNAASRAAGLTRQLLTFSRKQPRQSRVVALNAVVTGIEAMLTRIVGEDIAMSMIIAPDLGTVEADPGEIEQVLMNLVVNARDAMPSGGRLLLETRNAVVDDESSHRIGVSPGRYVVLAVSDTGYGMTDDIRSHIFEPFFTTKEVGKGTGLGLSTVFGIVQQGRGGIVVDSEPGQGTTFRVYWPRIDVVATSNPINVQVTAARGSGTVLVVEDDSQLRQVLLRYLTSWGYTPIVASNGLAALELLRGHAGAIDVLLTDIVMPGMDGRTLSQRVLADKPSTRVIFMSGYTEHPALDATPFGPDDVFVQKPFSAQTLSNVLLAVRGKPARGSTLVAVGERTPPPIDTR